MYFISFRHLGYSLTERLIQHVMESQSNLTCSYMDIVYFLLFNSLQALNNWIYVIGITEGQVFSSLIIRSHWLSILACICSYEKVP